MWIIAIEFLKTNIEVFEVYKSPMFLLHPRLKEFFSFQMMRYKGIHSSGPAEHNDVNDEKPIAQGV